MSQLLIEPGSTVLFQGDSITDAGWREDAAFAMGSGYARYVSAWLTASYPERKINFINRGIGGNRMCDLEARRTEDYIAL